MNRINQLRLKLGTFADLWTRHGLYLGTANWSPEEALSNGETVFVPAFDYETESVVIEDISVDNNTFTGFELCFKTEEDAQKFVENSSTVFEVLCRTDKVKLIKIEDLIAQVAKELLDSKGQTTTLEVKRAARANYPNKLITQQQVSDVMQELLHSEKLRVSAEFTNGKSHLRFYK